MININAEGGEIGQVINSHGSNQYFFNITSSTTEISLKKQGFDTSELRYELKVLKVGESFQISNVLDSLSQYTLSHHYELKCTTTVIEIIPNEYGYEVLGCEVGEGRLSIIVEGDVIDIVDFNIEYPTYKGVPQQWSFDGQPVYIPANLRFANPLNFEEHGFNRDGNKKGWAMKSFTPYVEITENGQTIGKIPVVFRHFILETDWKLKRTYEEGVELYSISLFSDDVVQQLPGFRNSDMSWFTCQMIQVNEIIPTDLGNQIFSLMIKDESGDWHPVLDSHSRQTQLSIDIKEWNINTALNDNITCVDKKSSSHLFKRYSVNSKVLNQIPSRYKFSDFQISLESSNGFGLSADRTGDELFIDVFCDGNEGYETAILIHLSSSTETVEIPICFEEEYDFDKTLFDDLNIKIYVKDKEIIAVHYSLPSFNYALADFLDIELFHEDVFICGIDLIEQGLISIVPSIPVDSSKFNIRNHWHPYGNVFQFEKDINLETVEREWLKPYTDHKLLNFHPILQKRMNERIMNTELSSCESIEHHICVAGSTINISDLENHSLRPLMFYFSGKGQCGVGRFQTFPDESGWSGANIGFDESRLPLHLENEEMKDLSRHIKDNGFTFNAAGVYIFAFSNISQTLPRNNYFGPTDTNCKQAYRYDNYLEIEVI
jgi:hypothetical protein